MNQLVFVRNKATLQQIHYTHHTYPSFIFKLKYSQKSCPCLNDINNNNNDHLLKHRARPPYTVSRHILWAFKLIKSEVFRSKYSLMQSQHCCALSRLRVARY
jgi:hypothetical protein